MAKRTRDRSETVHSYDDVNAAAPANPASERSGSIEQQLDMNESGPLRGEEILREHGARPRHNPRPTLTEEYMETNYRVDMSEDEREGDEESGDEHSSGLQGSDQQELQTDTDSPEDADSGLPGEMTNKVVHLDPSRRGYRRRAG